jgi:DNA-binding beta-propeller fold protein YncE
VHAAAPEPSKLEPSVPAALDEVVRRALIKRPEERQQSAGELGDAALAGVGGAPLARARRTHRRRTAATAVTLGDTPPARRRRPALATATVLLAAAVGAAAAVLFADGGADHSPATSVAGTTTVVTRPAPRKPAPPPHVVGAVRVGVHPMNVEVAGGSAWVASTGNPALGRIATRNDHHRSGPRLGYGISDIASRRGVLWVTVAEQHEVVQVHAKTGHVVGEPIPMDGEPRAIDAGEGAVWVAEDAGGGASNLVEIDPHSAAVVARTPIPEGINDIRAADGAVWLLGHTKRNLIKVSPASHEPIVRIHIGRGAQRLAVAAGYVWVTDTGDNEVTRVDPKGPRKVTVGVPSKPFGLHARADGIWVACYGDQSVVRIDPRRARRIGRPLAVGMNPVAVDVSHGSVWVTGVGDNSLTRIDL